MNGTLIEGCVDSYVSAMAAAKNGADRLELCANLSIGGTTPSQPLFEQIRRDCAVKINVLIRPRFGDFLYSRQELEEMAEEIERFRDLGANGVVIGVLTPQGELDRERMARLMDRAGGMEVTLHRAFDMTRDPGEALEDAVRLAEWLNKQGHMPEQVQDFYPTPGTLATCMWYTGLDPRTMKPVFVPKTPHDKALQRALMQWRKPQNRKLVLEALHKTGREDLIGFGKNCLLRPQKPQNQQKRKK